MAIDLSTDAGDNNEDKQRDANANANANTNVSLSLPSRLSSFFSNLTHHVPSSSSSVTVPSKRKTDSDADLDADLETDADSKDTSTSINGSSHAHVHAGHGRGRGRTDYHVAKKQSPGSRTLDTPSPGPVNIQQSTVSVVIHSPSYEKKREIQNAQWTRVRPPTAAPSVSGLSKRRQSSTDHQHSRRQTQKGHGDVHTARAVDATGATSAGGTGAKAQKEKVDRRSVSLRIGRPTVPILTDRPSTQIKQQLCRSFVRKLSKIQGPPVTLSRDVDDHVLTGIAANFEFVNEYKLRNGVVPVGEEFNGGCDCSTICDPMRCSCLSDAEETDEKLLPYQAAPDDAGMIVLTPEFRQRRSMIYECNSRCGCRGKCWNNVVQRGRTVRFEIFHTGNRGFGLRSPDFIRAGQFVDIYLGEVITLQTANVRGRLAAAEHAHCYLFDLDFLISDDTIYVIDGQKLGSPTRFMNHSCNPNCRMFPLSRNHGDNRLYDLAFFALRDIEPMTELTFDYNPGPVDADADPEADEDSDSDEDSDLEIDHRKHRTKGTSNAVKCLCGESNCRGQLWTAQRKGTK